MKPSPSAVLESLGEKAASLWLKLRLGDTERRDEATIKTLRLRLCMNLLKTTLRSWALILRSSSNLRRFWHRQYVHLLQVHMQRRRAWLRKDTQKCVFTTLQRQHVRAINREGRRGQSQKVKNNTLTTLLGQRGLNLHCCNKHNNEVRKTTRNGSSHNHVPR